MNKHSYQSKLPEPRHNRPARTRPESSPVTVVDQLRDDEFVFLGPGTHKVIPTALGSVDVPIGWIYRRVTRNMVELVRPATLSWVVNGKPTTFQIGRMA